MNDVELIFYRLHEMFHLLEAVNVIGRSVDPFRKLCETHVSAYMAASRLLAAQEKQDEQCDDLAGLSIEVLK